MVRELLQDVFCTPESELVLLQLVTFLTPRWCKSKKPNRSAEIVVPEQKDEECRHLCVWLQVARRLSYQDLPEQVRFLQRQFSHGGGKPMIQISRISLLVEICEALP
jgi:hypothetical protein